MDKIEKIRKEIERLKGAVTTTIKELRMPEPSDRMRGELDAYDDVLWFLDTLEEEPLCIDDGGAPSKQKCGDCTIACEAKVKEEPDKSLDETATKFANTQNKNFLNPEIVKNIFIAGAEWQKEQIMKEALECDVIVPIYEGSDVWSAEIKIPGRYKPRDKVKLIILGGDKFKVGDRIIYHGNGYEITGVDDKWYKVKADIPSQIPELEINAISKDNEKDIKRQE